MTLLVDTSVWSLALRRDTPPKTPEVVALHTALTGAELVVTTGLILQELLQGLLPKHSHDAVISRFATLPLISPDREDHVEAARLRNRCRLSGVQLGTIDALIAQLTIRHGMTLLSTDRDFAHAARHIELRLWQQNEN